MQALLKAFAKQASASKELTVGARVDAQVQLVKQDAAYLVATVSGHPAQVAFVPTADYNLQRGAHRRAFKVGQTLSATVARLPTASDSRLLLHAALVVTAAHAKVRAPSAVEVTLVTGMVSRVHHTHANVSLDKGKGRLHATEVEDADPATFDEVRAACA
jgi:hypothetical protein